MSRNHRNRSWRTKWTLEPANRTAVHKSGVIARIQLDQAEPSKEQIIMENTDNIDVDRWDLKQLTEQSIKLWREGAF